MDKQSRRSAAYDKTTLTSKAAGDPFGPSPTPGAGTIVINSINLDGATNGFTIRTRMEQYNYPGSGGATITVQVNL